MPLEVGEILRHVAPREDPAVHGRMECDDPVPEQLGEPGELLERGHVGEPRIGEESRRAPAREQLDAQALQPFRERRQTGLVVRRQQRAPDAHASASSLHDLGQEPVLDLADPRVQALARIAHEDRHPFLPQDRAGVDPVVDEVDGGAGLVDTGPEGLLDRVSAREGRQERRVHVDDRARETVEEAGPEEVHVARADDELDTVPLEPRGHRGVARVPVGVAVERKRRAGHTGALPPGARRCAPGLLDATAATATPASSSACRFEPSPLTRVPTRRPTGPRAPPRP